MNEGVIRKILNLDQKPPPDDTKATLGRMYVRRISNLPSNIDISWDGDRRHDGLSLRWGGGGRGGSISTPQADIQQHPLVGTRSGVARRGRCNLVPGRQNISIIIAFAMCRTFMFSALKIRRCWRPLAQHLKKNLNAPRASEHPPVRGEKCQNV